jgi:molybdopterin/thiamine biosynthesis adenylyltransferase
LDLRAKASDDPLSSNAISDASPRHRNESNSNSTAGFSNGGAIEERYLRNASIVDQEAINRQPVAIVGVGAIGSHLAEMLAKLGVRDFTLIDPDEVDTINLSTQGFAENQIGQLKVEAVEDRLRQINPAVAVQQGAVHYHHDLIPPRAAVFACVDSMPVRRQIFRDFCEHDWPVFFDGRMAAESLRVFCIDRNDRQAADLYRQSLFPSHEVYREGCTVRATIYCASMAAAILCALYKRWCMHQSPAAHLHFALLSMDCFM